MTTALSDDYSLQTPANPGSYLEPPALTDAAPDDGQLACCWSETKPALLDIGAAVLFGLSGIATTIFGVATILRPDGSRVAGGVVLVVLGVLLLVAGLFFLLYKVMRPQHAIAIYDDGVEIVQNETSQKYLWQEIHKIVTLEFVPHVGARMVYVVTIEPKKGSVVRFDTNYEGDALEVFYYLTTNCDYIVRNPRGYTKRTS